jgi:hypothetical protein
MRYLTWVLLIAACAPAEKHPDSTDGGAIDAPGMGSGSNTPHTIDAHWTIKTLAGVSQPCPAGFDAAVLTSQQVDDDNTDIGAPIIDTFDCAAMDGVSSTVPYGMFFTSIVIENRDTHSEYAKSVEAFVDLTDDDSSFNVDIYTDAGYFTFAWDLSHLGQQTSCALSALTQVESVTTNTMNSASVFDDKFSCSDGNGVTSPLPAGTYTISVDALTGITSRGTADPVTATITVPNRITDLGVVAVPIQ